ncbi:MAG: GNAT family N-acetyltransferase [Bacteroidota bacterium]|jgi:ribosomal protein S18 acetylase RimI-like enzyme
MIVRATLDDVPALNKLVNSAYRGESSKKGWTSEADLLGGVRTNEEGLTETINKSDTIILKYTEDQEVIGCVMLVEQENQVYLGMLTVSPDLQGKGIGKKLLEAAEVTTKELGKSKIGMTVISLRKELIEYYQRYGYVPTGEKKPFPMNDPNFGEPKQFLEFIVMEKII